MYLLPTQSHFIASVSSGKFPGGILVITPGALEIEEAAFAAGKLICGECLIRHFSGDWGDLGAEDKAENELSLREGFRLLSSYQTPFGKLWIITEADRSATTILTPDEY